MKNNIESIKKELVHKIEEFINNEMTANELYNWAISHPHFVEKIDSPTQEDILIDHVLGVMVTLNEEPLKYHTTVEDLRICLEYLLDKRKYTV